MAFCGVCSSQHEHNTCISCSVCVCDIGEYGQCALYKYLTVHDFTKGSADKIKIIELIRRQLYRFHIIYVFFVIMR